MPGRPTPLGLTLPLIVLLAACQTAPVEPPPEDEELVVSRGVAEYFEDDETDQVVAGQGNDIKCVRERRVGTHLITRICRTKAEWAALYRANQEAQRNSRTGPCGAGAPSCGDGPRLGGGGQN